MMRKENVLLVATVLLLSAIIVTYYTLGLAIVSKPVGVAMALLIPVAAWTSASCLWAIRPRRGIHWQALYMMLYGVATMLTAYLLVLAFAPIFLNAVIYDDLRVYRVGIVHSINTIFGMDHRTAVIFSIGIPLFSLTVMLMVEVGIARGVRRMRTAGKPFLLIVCMVVVAVVSCFSALNSVLLAKTTSTFGDFDGFHAGVLLASGETQAIDTFLENGNEAKFNLLKLRGTFIPHGEYLEYHADGKLERELKYYFGVPHGEIAYYYPSGQIAISGKMFMGVPTGEWKYIYANGQIAGVGIQSDEASWQIYDASGNPIKSFVDSIGAISGNFLKSGVKFNAESVFYFDVLQAPVWVQNREGGATKILGPFNFPVP